MFDWKQIGREHPEWVKPGEVEVNPNNLTEEQCEILINKWPSYVEVYEDALEFQYDINNGSLDECCVRIFWD